MIAIKGSTNFIKAFAFRDALFRSTGLIGGTFAIAVISLLPGFGVKGLLIATSIQLLLSAFLELPTSIIADKFGRSLVLRISLFLKLFVSVCLGFAIYFASIDETQWVWYAFFCEAALDAISNTLVSGSYQVAYLTQYEQSTKDVDNPPPLFLKSFEYSLKFRFLFPIGFVLFVVLLFQFAKISQLNLYNCAYIILSLIISARLFLFLTVNQDFRNIDPATDKAKTGIVTGLKEVVQAVASKKMIFFTYSIATLFSFIGFFYLIGQANKLFQPMGLSANSIWLAAIGTSILIYLLRTSVIIWLLPRISKKFFNIIIPFLGFLVFLGGTSLIGMDRCLESNSIKYLFFVTLATTLFIISDALSKSIESALKVHVQSEYKATWLSLGNTSAYIIFGLLSAIISKYLFSYANEFIGGLIALSGLFIFFSQILAKKKEERPSFNHVLRKQLIKILLLVVIFVVIIDVGSYALITRQKIDETKAKTASTVLLGIKSSVLRGDLIEASNFLYSLKSGNFIKCFQLDLKRAATDDCQLNGIILNEYDSEKFIIQYDNNNYGEVLLYFDFKPMHRDFYYRVVLDIFLSFVLYSLLFYIFHLIARAISTEVEYLHLSLDVDQRGKTDSIFKIREFHEINEHLFEALKLRDSLQFQSALANVASQVSHDIRSPLSALSLMINHLHQIPEDKRIIIRSAVNRINDIANQLLQKSREISTQPYSVGRSSDIINLKAHLLSPLIDDIVSEKRVQFRDKQGVEIETDLIAGYGLFADIDAVEIKRALSNLINNSIDAFPNNTGKIVVTIRSSKDHVSILVRDNGQGIPPHILAKLGEKGISHGKEGTTSGSGLGVWHAKQSTESVNGKFEILSKVGLGTTITMSFPKAPPPNWFVEKLTLKTNMQLVSLDDDLSIHQIWKGRLQSLNSESFGISLLSFTSGNEFENYIKTQVNDTAQKIFLVDYELLNQNMTGLDLIEKLDLGAKAMLVTSRYEEEHIRSRCAKLGVKLIPKGMAGFVPIEIEKPKQKYDAILIDDDELIHMTWQIVAKEKNKLIKLFKTEAEFLAVANEIDLLTPLYVDVNLGEKVNGIEVAKRIHELGFNKIYLATGYAEIEKPGFIEAVVGKDPQL